MGGANDFVHPETSTCKGTAKRRDFFEKTWDDLDDSSTHRIHVWYIYLYLALGCRENTPYMDAMGDDSSMFRSTKWTRMFTTRIDLTVHYQLISLTKQTPQKKTPNFSEEHVPDSNL